MAFQTGTATSLSNLLSQLLTFATANGWTQDRFDTGNGELAMSKNTIFVSMRWIVGTEITLSIHQALAFVGGQDGGDHTDDSGNGYNGVTAKSNGLLDDERCVNDIGDGPFPSYHFFENDASLAYLHVVVEITTGVFRHFGFGEIDKCGNWSGGEYVYGHNMLGLPSDNNLTSLKNTTMMDGLFADNAGSSPRRGGTMHVESLPGMVAAEKWGQVWGQQSAAPPTASDGEDKVTVQGGYKSGPIARSLGFFIAGSTSGLIPMYPFGIWYVRRSPTNHGTFLGFQPDVRGVNIKNFAPKDEVVISSATWVLFPDSQKTNDNVTDRSYNRGIAYKKVTA